MSRLELREFDWSELVALHFFENIFFGGVGTVAGLVLFQTSTISPPSGVLISWPVSGLCVFLAYLRIWKSIREEHETSALWEEAVQNGRYTGVLDRIVEVPYVLCLMVLPFAAIGPQLFMLTLLVFYLTDNYYNLALAQIVAVAAPVTPATGTDAEEEQQDLSGYFSWRIRLNWLFAVLLVLSCAVVTWRTLDASGGDAPLWAFAALGLITAIEWVVEPFRNVGIRFDSNQRSGSGPAA